MNYQTKAFIVENWKWFVLFVMLGFVMYWTAIVVEPTLNLQITQRAQQEWNNNSTYNIIQNQNNNTDRLEQLIQTADENNRIIIHLFDFFRENFGEDFLRSENAQRIATNETLEILRNASK